MSCPGCADSVGIRLLELMCSCWHPRQTNEAVASERSIFRSFISCRGEPIHTYISGLDARGGRKLRKDTSHIESHTRDNYSNPRCDSRRGLNMVE